MLYVGGMYLNDAFDSRLDAQYRPERPIPSGAITRRAVSAIGGIMLGLGVALFAWTGPIPGWIALGLAACIVLYDAVHKKTSFAPILMASCRFLLYVAAASAGAEGLSESVFWGALALGLYVAGLSCLARHEATGERVNYWALLLLVAPVIIAGMLYGFTSAKVSLVLPLFAGWLAWCLWPLVRVRAAGGAPRASSASAGLIGRAVGGLLAGIVLVDLLLVPVSGTILLMFPLLFAGALILQRAVPAT